VSGNSGVLDYRELKGNWKQLSGIAGRQVELVPKYSGKKWGKIGWYGTQ
jgi:NAD-dependent SIR2 family protein deacetylase